MTCTYFGPYDPQKQPPDTVPKWMESCPSAGGPFPKACLSADGTYDLYCCDDAGDWPCKESAKSVVICLPPEAVVRLQEAGRIEILDGLGAIAVPRRRRAKRPSD